MCLRRCKKIRGEIEKYEEIWGDRMRYEEMQEIRIDVLDTKSFPYPLNRYKYEAIREDTGSGEEIRGISGVVRNCKEIRRVPRRNEEMPGDGRTTLEQPGSNAEAPGLARS